MTANRAEHTDALLQRICGEYMEMPGLRLSAAQAERLWGLDAQTCAGLLALLVERRFLQRTSDGRFARLTDGGTRDVPLRMIKAAIDPAARAPARARSA